MPGKTAITYGNEIFDGLLLLPSVTFPTLGANASSTTTTVVPGVLPLDLISWNMQNPPAHLVIDNIWVSAANTLSILWGTDSTGISTSTIALLLEVIRADGGNLGAAGIPAALV